MTYKKTYIQVSALFNSSGDITPMQLRWSDGRIFPIENISEIKNCPSRKVFGFGQRFTVNIAGKERYLFLEPAEMRSEVMGRWFVEEPVKDAT